MRLVIDLNALVVAISGERTRSRPVTAEIGEQKMKKKKQKFWTKKKSGKRRRKRLKWVELVNLHISGHSVGV